MPRSVAPLTLSEDQQNQIEQWLAAMGTPQQVALRCRIVLSAAGGESEAAIASALEINRKTVRLWRERFAKEGLQGLWVIAAGRGRKATYGPERVKAVLDATLQSKPKGQTHWSCRLMAASQGISKSTVSNLWKSHNIKPHRTKTFKLSRDPKFLEKLTDVVGLYLNPPDKAIVLCVDEKSQIQALNRTQPGLPLKKGRCGTMTHDYKRNGTTTLFAALDLLQGRVIGDFHKRHRHPEFLKFLQVVRCSHILASWVTVAPLNRVLQEAIDGGQLIRADLWHPWRLPVFHAKTAVRQLHQELIDALDRAIQEKGTPPADDWHAVEIGKVVEIFAHAATRGEAIARFLEPPQDEERARRVSIPIYEVPI